MASGVRQRRQRYSIFGFEEEEEEGFWWLEVVSSAVPSSPKGRVAIAGAVPVATLAWTVRW